PTAPLSFSLRSTPPLKIYTLSLHDALPIFMISLENCPRKDRPSGEGRSLSRLVLGDRSHVAVAGLGHKGLIACARLRHGCRMIGDRKSTRLNSSHVKISYAVFCLKKKTESL